MAEPMVDPKLVLLLVVLTNAGGTGKTHFTEVFECLARMAGMSVCVVDADQGCRGYRNRNGNSNATLLDWNPSEPPIATQWFSHHLARNQVGIIDLGANFLSMETPASELLNEVVEIARSQNARVVFAPVNGSDKAGGTSLTDRLYGQFSNNFDVVIVKNDNRGTGNFGKSRLLDPPTLSIPYLPAGYESVRLRLQRRLDEVICEPESGYAMASAAIAHRLLQIAREPIVEELLGTAMRAPLEAASKGHPGQLRYLVTKPADARDEKLRANMALSAARSVVARSAGAAAEVRLAAFEAEHEAELRYNRS